MDKNAFLWQTTDGNRSSTDRAASESFTTDLQLDMIKQSFFDRTLVCLEGIQCTFIKINEVAVCML